MDWIAWIIIALLIVVWILDKKKSTGKNTPKSTKETAETEANESSTKDYSKSYQAKYLLTKNEWYEHKKLQKYATDKGFIVCPKVRLLDIIEPRKGESDYKSLFYKVQAKHVDFVICDQSMHIKAIIELDDNSHNQKDRRSRDTFVDQILTSVGYKVIHTRYITETTMDSLAEPEKTPEGLTE